MTIHPAADIFPLMGEAEYRKLVDDIREFGLLDPIWVLDGQILDGRHRFRACQELGVEVSTRTYEGDNPTAFVVSLNLFRRHLSESQRAMVATRIANLPRGRSNVGIPTFSQPEAAEMLNVSRDSVVQARKVVTDGIPDLILAVDGGRASVSAAAQVATLPAEEQQVIVAKGEEEILAAAKRIRMDRTEANREERRIAKLEAANIPPPEGSYRCIVIDPPWDMEKVGRDVRPAQSGFDYPTMTEEELAALDVPGMADDDCHLFCWTTQKYLPSALRLVERWGFRYVFCMVWHKPGGFQPYNLPQYNCEFVVYARRGTPEFVDTKAFNTCFEAPRREHSRKPDEFYALIERVTGSPRIDVFSREEREGFDQFGNETGKFAA